ncbi:hypothetical protein Tco_1042832 [Tanacetum coccineum]|uniref:Reverse transcriptase domain-containing protein n=1 Tax=Tanacetum coccineum TaxID=301880 RepID=A0ABQ5GMC2_9ASTR
MANLTDMLQNFVTANTAFHFGSGTLPSVTDASLYKRTHEDVQPPVVQIQSRNPNPEPNVAPVVTPASIPFPSRRKDEQRKEKARIKLREFYDIFRDV